MLHTLGSVSAAGPLQHAAHRSTSLEQSRQFSTEHVAQAPSLGPKPSLHTSQVPASSEHTALQAAG